MNNTPTLTEFDVLILGRLRETQSNLESRFKKLEKLQHLTNAILVVGFVTTTILLLRR